jgi:hypothetical protein
MASASLLTRPSMGSIPLRAGKGSRSKCEHVTFNHGVEGSSPSALTKNPSSSTVYQVTQTAASVAHNLKYELIGD